MTITITRNIIFIAGLVWALSSVAFYAFGAFSHGVFTRECSDEVETPDE